MLRTWIRRYLGTHNLEDHMATATEQLTAVNAKVDDLLSDVRAALAVINQDNLSDTAQAELDRLTAKIDAFDTEIGDTDGSDTPTEPDEDILPENTGR